MAHEHPNLVVVERAPSTLEAERLVSLLKKEGIAAYANPYSPEETVAGEYYAEFTGIDVRVRPEDAARARAILEEARRAGRHLDELDPPHQSGGTS